MSRSRIVFFCASSLLVLLVVGGSLMGAAAGKDGGDDSLYKYLSVFTETLSLVQQAYVEDVDLETLMAGALDSTTEAMDPFSLYLPEAEVEAYLEAREVGGRLSGLTLLKERGIAFVAAVEPGSPADEAGLRVSDVVTEIDGRSTRPMPVWELQEILAGEPGTVLSLDLLRQGERQSVELTLGPYERPRPTLETVDGAPVLHLGSFRAENVEILRQLLEGPQAQSADGMVLDLRGVAGGNPEVAYRMAGFLTSGELGVLDRRGETLETFSDDTPPLWQGRLVVVVNRGTLGAAEVLAKVLRQAAGAELVGEPTFGYAGRQAQAKLASGGQLIYTDAFYSGPDGEVVRGSVEPDLRVTAASRTFDERELPMWELILQRGIRHLLEEDGAAEESREAA